MESQTPTPVSSGGSPPPATAPDAGGDPTRPAGSPPASWLGSLTDESLRGHQGLTKFKDVDSLAKSYVELDKLRNERSGVKPLTAESTPDEIAAYRQAMGIPEAPEKYELGELRYPDEVTPSQEELAGWRKTFHDLHLTPAQAQGILQAHALDTSTKFNAIAAQQHAQSRDTMGLLSKKYGAEAPALAQLAHDYVQRRWGDEGLEALEFQPGNPSSVGNSPVLFEMILESAKLTGHDKFIVADGRGVPMDQASALTKYNELSAKFYGTQDEAARAALQAEMNRYAPRAFGG